MTRYDPGKPNDYGRGACAFIIALMVVVVLLSFSLKDSDPGFYLGDPDYPECVSEVLDSLVTPAVSAQILAARGAQQHDLWSIVSYLAAWDVCDLTSGNGQVAVGVAAEAIALILQRLEWTAPAEWTAELEKQKEKRQSARRTSRLTKF